MIKKFFNFFLNENYYWFEGMVKRFSMIYLGIF
jgi:hypothetical protein